MFPIQFFDNKIREYGYKMGTEEKSENFKRLATYRTQKALTAIHSVGRLANTHNYAYTTEQTKKVINALKEALADVESEFKKGASKKDQFTL